MSSESTVLQNKFNVKNSYSYFVLKIQHSNIADEYFSYF